MCKDCEARRKLARDAFLNAKLGIGLGHLVKGAVEAAKLKSKTGSKELAIVQSKTKRESAD